MDNSHTVTDGRDEEMRKTSDRAQDRCKGDKPFRSVKSKRHVFLHKSLIRKNIAAWTTQLT